jgi:hypothetical protein
MEDIMDYIGRREVYASARRACAVSNYIHDGPTVHLTQSYSLQAFKRSRVSELQLTPKAT